MFFCKTVEFASVWTTTLKIHFLYTKPELNMVFENLYEKIPMFVKARTNKYSKNITWHIKWYNSSVGRAPALSTKGR